MSKIENFIQSHQLPALVYVDVSSNANPLTEKLKSTLQISDPIPKAASPEI